MPRNRAKERWKARFFTVNHRHLATFRRTTFYSATLGTMRPFLSIFSALALASQAAATQAPPPALVLASTAPGAPARTAAKQVRRRPNRVRTRVSKTPIHYTPDSLSGL